MDPQSVWAMDPYYYHQHPILQQQYYYYAYAVPAHYTMMPIPVQQYVDDVAILNTMWVNQEHPIMRSYFQNQNYVPYPPPEETSFFNTYDSLTLDETLFMQEIEEDISALQGVVPAGTSGGSGLSEEEISEHLQVYT